MVSKPFGENPQLADESKPSPASWPEDRGFLDSLLYSNQKSRPERA